MTAPPGQQQQQLGSRGQLVVSLPQVLQGETEDTIADVAVAVLGLSEEACAALRQLPQGLQKRILMKLRAAAAGGAGAAAAGGDCATDFQKLCNTVEKWLFEKMAHSALMWQEEAAEQQPGKLAKKVA
jgi:hypothetical protein